MKRIVSIIAGLISCVVLLTAAAQAQTVSPIERPNGIQLEMDSSSARALLGLFGRAKISDEELSTVAKMPGTQAMIRQAARFDPAATEDNFKASLRKVIQTGSAEPDPFRFGLVKTRLEAVRTLLNQLEQSPQKFIGSVSARMREYSPAHVSFKSSIHFIVGGTSDGFAPTGDAFYIALHYYGDDYDGLTMLAAHELFHNVQAVLRKARTGDKQPPAEPAHVANSVAIMGNVVNEGTASLVGDAFLLPSGKQYSDFLRAKYKRNLDRIKSNFALFETLLYRAYNDAAADYGQLYQLGFSGTWDSPLYFVGYRMAKMIEKYRGREAIRNLVGADPRQFFTLYMQIYQKENDPEIVKFSKSAEEILRKLDQVKNR